VESTPAGVPAVAARGRSTSVSGVIASEFSDTSPKSNTSVGLRSSWSCRTSA
jgi:hypothetical protein